MFAGIARGVIGNRQHSQIKSNQMFLLAYMIYIILTKERIYNKAIRDGKYLARHMPVLGNVHPIKIKFY